MRKYRRLIGAIQLGLLCAVNAQTVDWSRVVGRTAPSVVTISATDGEDYWNGTGFFISSDGKIATNYHVVRNAYLMQVRLENGKTFNARLLAVDPSTDLAILKVNGRGFRALPLGDIRSVKRGQPVCVIGSSLGYLAGSLSDGVVSAVRMGDGFTWIQMTAPISSGNSGSPVLNQQGQVIGIATLTFTQGQNLNFAVGVNHLRALMASQSTRATRSTRPKPALQRPASITVRNAKELVAAVQRVQSGGEIILRQGEYRLTRTLSINKPITLRGAGSTKTRLVGTAASAVIVYSGQGDFKAVGVAFHYAGQQPTDVVQIVSGNVHFTDCVIAGGKARETEDSTYYGRGILVGDAACILERCIIRTNQTVGLYAINQSQVTLRRTQITDNGLAGVATGNESVCYMYQNVFRRNKVDVAAGDSSLVHSEQNNFADSQVAFYYSGFSTGILIRNTIHAVRTGVHLTDTAAVSLEDNHIQMWKKEELLSLGEAVRMEGESSCDASRNTIKSLWCAISVSGKAKLSLDNSLIEAPMLLIGGDASFTAKKNTFTGCGIWALGNATARILENRFWGNRSSGIWLDDQVSVEIYGNLFRDFKVAIYYASERTDSSIVNNRFLRNQIDIFLEKGKRTAIWNNHQESNLQGEELVFVGVYEEWWQDRGLDAEKPSSDF